MNASHKSFSRSRRDCLKAGFTGVASTGLLLGGGLSSTKLIAAPADCIRSPWAYYPFPSSVAQKALDYGNENLPSLMPLTQDSAQWAVQGAWKGNGIDTGLELPWIADPVGMEAIMLPKRGAYLVGVLVGHGRALDTGAEVIFRAGQQVTTDTGQKFSELELKINVNGRAMIDLYDDSGKRAALSVIEKVPDTNNGQVIIFAYIDHRINGEELVRIYQYIPGTTQRTTRSKRIASLGDISGGPASEHKLINIGMRRNGYGHTLKHFNGVITRLNIVNFGNRPPADIDSILDGFSLARMAPGSFMEGV